MALKKVWRRSGRRIKGIWPFRATWYSICSIHQRHHPKCNICSDGIWINDNRHTVSSFVYKRWPDFWRWWVNRNNPYKAPSEGRKRG